jgi:hypothetical protein
MTRITMEGIDERIAKIRTVLDRATGNLVELDADVTRRLLESSTSLRGVTAESWADASRRHAELWRGQFALESVLTQIAETRGTRRSLPHATLIRLDQLLGTECVELPRPPGPGLPKLTDGPAPTISLTIEAALRQMSEDYEVVARVVAAVADVWGEPAERLHRVAGEVEELEQRLRDQGVRRSNELQAIALAVAETELLVRDDPLALSPTTVEELQARATRLRASLEEILRGRAARLADLEAVEESIAAGRAAVAAGREELDRVARKILVLDETRAALERVALEYDRLAGEAGLARQPGATGSCSALAVQAEGLMEEVTRLAGTVDAGIRTRDELRGVLTAYQAKAQALGLAEDVELGELYAATREELYSAPCDLGRAEQRVLEYQRAIRAGSGGRS